MEKKFESRINNPHHLSESLETVFRVKNTSILLSGSGIRNLFEPGSGNWEGEIRIRIRMKTTKVRLSK
jgi:hypothetical protein